ncbi:hypothetical protein TRICI_002807 [Trichomonascus ciferrii]|uniref:Ubiquitin carboxyl-terminal hydrolase n=1 Tax=Trichomonascus ciferrii TaxID=44093 RepID=A0A642V6U0_9ASCO|nr:hypothetical protein TRICI_002807 [Trichomonascus ciferrii]
MPESVSSNTEINSLTDGSAKIFGMENFGNTCYCNSVLQCLYYSKPFREHILNLPTTEKTKRSRKTSVTGKTPHPFTVDPNAATLNTSTTAQQNNELGLNAVSIAQSPGGGENGNANPASPTQEKQSGSLGRKMSLFKSNKDSSDGESKKEVKDNGALGIINAAAQAASQKLIPAYKGLEGLQLGLRFPGQNLPVVGFTDDPFATPEQKKRAALVKGPIVNMDLSFSEEYNMSESLFTAMKDLFEAMAENSSRVGVASPSRLIEVLKRDNEPFRSSMHQDAHEFFNFALNEVLENVDRQATMIEAEPDRPAPNKWIHDLFEGLLTSETKCLTCENVSRRDEQFLDLSIDLERNTSVTSCLRQFSASEMLCERNKFHCDNCGGLQEAEKRMKVKKLPKILALHLKRFKFTEDMQRNVKLFHRVVYPKHIRLFNTTYDAEDPDKLYELSAVVVHIGGGPHHGHYVSVVKTEHAGWLLFDDEMVESVDPNYVFNFFGDNKGMATAYVLFYQEISASQLESENLYTNEDSLPQHTQQQSSPQQQAHSPGANGAVPVTNGAVPVTNGHDDNTNSLTPPSIGSPIMEEDENEHQPDPEPYTLPEASGAISIPNNTNSTNLTKVQSLNNTSPNGGVSPGTGLSRFRTSSLSKKTSNSSSTTKKDDPSPERKKRGLSWSFKKRS